MTPLDGDAAAVRCGACRRELLRVKAKLGWAVQTIDRLFLVLHCINHVSLTAKISTLSTLAASLRLSI